MKRGSSDDIQLKVESIGMEEVQLSARHDLTLDYSQFDHLPYSIASMCANSVSQISTGL